MRFTRFERKILAALVAVAAVPMVGALVLGQGALLEAYQVGVNPRIQQQLDDGLSLYRAHFAELKRSANHAADAIAGDHLLYEALASGDDAALSHRAAELVDRYEVVRAVRVMRAGTQVVAAGEATGDDPALRVLQLTRELDVTGQGDAAMRAHGDAGLAGPPLHPSHAPAPSARYHMELTVVAPAAPFLAYQRAGEVAQVFRRLERESGTVSRFYLAVYMGFLLSVIVVAVAVGVVLSRRVTRRVAVLAEATERVGAGDLSVQVPTSGDDEIGELTRSFNDMVREMRESRGRIDYLQRIGAWQEFARRLAHEIKNPLTPIQLAVQEVAKTYPGGDDAFAKRLADAAAIVEEEVATLRRLVGEFSAFARLPQAKLEPADLGAFLSETVRALEGVAEEYRIGDGHVSIRCDVPRQPIPVHIDAMMLRRGLDNLVRNSIQAFDASVTDPRVEVRARRDGSKAVVEVSDNGPGIDPDARQRIFDPYYTTKADGTGLGLAIVKKVVLEHGGEIICRDSRPRGVTFEISLPLG